MARKRNTREELDVLRDFAEYMQNIEQQEEPEEVRALRELRERSVDQTDTH